MIYVIGNPTEWQPEYKFGTWQQFEEWITNLNEVEFDIETTVSPWWCEKKVITVQFGWKDVQWVLQWSELSEQQKNFIKMLLEERTLTKLIHNALFECTVMLFHGIRVLNVYDTMLAEMVLQGGEHTVGYGLDDLCLRMLDVVLDKSQQTTFGDNILTPEKVVYAAQDVKHLRTLRDHIRFNADGLGYTTFDQVVELENSIVPAFAEMVYNGMEIDKSWWLKLAEEAEPLVSAALEKLNNWLQEEPFKSKAYELNYLAAEDRILINWASGKQKTLMFSQLFPELPGTSKAVLKKWQSDRLKAQLSVPEWLPYYLDGDTSELTKVVVTNHRQWLIDNALLIPAGTPTINWGSQQQVLPLFQLVEKIKDLSAESLGRTSHGIVNEYQDYKNTTKLLSSFGEEFLTKYVEPDGKVRTSFKQVLTTGRTSSSSPNQQQLPKNERVGTKYRNAFILSSGWKWVSTDFVSEELVIITHLSKEPVWLEALSKGEDLHSRVSEVVFGKKWKDAAQINCAYYQKLTNGEIAKQKCNCTKHKYMRNTTKVLNFMLAYGGGEFKLASTLRISVPEAKQIIQDYFKALPKLKSLLDYLGRFGIENGLLKQFIHFIEDVGFLIGNSIEDL